jgi:hypothetical protein
MLLAAALALSALGPGAVAAQRVVLRHQPLGALPDREPPVIVVVVEGNDDAIEQLRVHYREVGRLDFTIALMTLAPDGRATARLPLLSGTDASYAIQYYVEATARDGEVLGRVGSEQAPLQLTVPAAEESAPPPPEDEEEPVEDPGPLAPLEEEEEPGERRGIASRWWFWTLIGAVVIGGAVTAGVLLSGSDGGPNGSLGTFRLGE